MIANKAPHHYLVPRRRGTRRVGADVGINMNGMKRVWWTLFGGFVGAHLGILVTIGFTVLYICLNPDDQSAGSGALSIVLFLPVGFIAGLVVGLLASIIKRWESESDAGPIRSRRSYITLGVVCGLAGCHNYYAGYYRRAVTQISLTLFASPLWGIGIIATLIWVVIDLLTVAQDANGKRMK